MTSREPDDEDEKWREIVAHYGDAPDAAELDAIADLDDPWDPLGATEDDTPRAVPGSSHEPDAGHTVREPDDWRPPDPGPLPLPTPPRLAAWTGVFGAPALLLVLTLLPWTVPSWLTTVLLVWFVIGFGFLVATMNSGPRDPGDDGARV